MTSRPSGPHRGQVPSPGSGGAAASSDPGDPPGLHSGRPPLLRVVKGEPSAEELAALTVVVAALSQRRERSEPLMRFRGVVHSGMFPCFLAGSTSRLDRSSRSALTTSTRVSCGAITAST